MAAARLGLEEKLIAAAITAHGETNPDLSARTRLSSRQWKGFSGMLAALAIALFFAPITTLIALNAVFLGHGLLVLGLRVTLLTLSIRRPPRRRGDAPALAEDALPTVTILCPLYKEEEGLPHLMEALGALDYPADKLDIKLLVEADDPSTTSLARQLGGQAHIDIVTIPAMGPRTKPKALNYGLLCALGSLVVVYDAEDRPAPDQLRRAAATFAKAPKAIVCLQARLNYYNRDESLITRLFAIEYAFLFDLVLPGLARLGAPLPLGGTSNIFRAEALIALGGWDPYNVTEDADLGLRMAARGLRSAVLNSTTYEEATSRTGPWIKQRIRWIKGYMQTWAVHARATPPGRRLLHALTLHILVGAVVIAALINPIFWGLYIAWMLDSASVAPLFPAPLAIAATTLLLCGNLFHLWMFMLAPLRRRWHDLVPYAGLAPIYWTLQSIAGYLAAWAFIRRPYFWAKTDHGPGEAPTPVHTRMAAWPAE